MNNAKCGIVIHNIEHARAALKASSATKVSIAIVSAPYAGCYAGVSWFVKIEEKIEPGTFCDVKITEAMEYDLIGERC